MGTCRLTTVLSAVTCDALMNDIACRVHADVAYLIHALIIAWRHLGKGVLMGLPQTSTATSAQVSNVQGSPTRILTADHGKRTMTLNHSYAVIGLSMSMKGESLMSLASWLGVAPLSNAGALLLSAGLERCLSAAAESVCCVDEDETALMRSCSSSL